MKKLSELSNDEMLLVGNTIMDKEDFLIDRELCDYDDVVIYTTHTYKASFDAKFILERAIEDERWNGEIYEGWDERVWSSITDEDIQMLQNVLDMILENVGDSVNTSYIADELVEIDM